MQLKTVTMRNLNPQRVYDDSYPSLQKFIRRGGRIVAHTSGDSGEAVPGVFPWSADPAPGDGLFTFDALGRGGEEREGVD